MKKSTIIMFVVSIVLAVASVYYIAQPMWTAGFCLNPSGSGGEYTCVNSYVKQCDASAWKNYYYCEDGCYDMFEGVSHASPYGLCNEPDCSPDNYEYKCYSGDVWYHDKCGERTSLKSQCDDGCSEGQCVVAPDCTPDKYEKRCYSGEVYWYDKCGDRNTLYEECDNGCLDGACEDTPLPPPKCSLAVPCDDKDACTKDECVNGDCVYVEVCGKDCRGYQELSVDGKCEYKLSKLATVEGFKDVLEDEPAKVLAIAILVLSLFSIAAVSIKEKYYGGN